MSKTFINDNKREIFWLIILFAILFFIKKVTSRLSDFFEGYTITEEDKKALKDYNNSFNAKKYTILSRAYIVEANVPSYHYSEIRKRYEISKGAACWFPINDTWLVSHDKKIDETCLGLFSLGYGSDEEMIVACLTTDIYNEATRIYNQQESTTAIDNPYSTAECQELSIGTICQNLAVLTSVTFGIKKYFPHFGTGSFDGIPVNLSQYLAREFEPQELAPINEYWNTKGIPINF